jgi:hypothetical protein
MPDIPIVFQCPFRFNIIYTNNEKTIESRELIFNMLSDFALIKNVVVIHDPSIFIKHDHACFNGSHGGYHFTTNTILKG